MASSMTIKSNVVESSNGTVNSITIKSEGPALAPAEFVSPSRHDTELLYCIKGYEETINSLMECSKIFNKHYNAYVVEKKRFDTKDRYYKAINDYVNFVFDRNFDSVTSEVYFAIKRCYITACKHLLCTEEVAEKMKKIEQIYLSSLFEQGLKDASEIYKELSQKFAI